MSINAAWSRTLKEAFHARPGVEPRGIRLPSDKEITFVGDVSRLRIKLARTAVIRNMQDDSAAFEGWGLVLMAWCGVENIELDGAVIG
jgi:hypothetical protein